MPVSLYPPGEHLTVYLEALRLFRHILPVEGVLCHLNKPPLVGWLLQHRAGDNASLLADLQPGGALGANVQYGSMVVMSLQKYSKLISDVEYNEYIESALDEADAVAEDKNTKYLTHEEVFDTLRRKLSE